MKMTWVGWWELLGAGGLILGVRERNGALEFQVFGMTTKAQT